MGRKTHQPCPDCGSSDALIINEDGSTKCFSCGKSTFKNKKTDTEIVKEISKTNIKELLEGEYQDLKLRHINKDTCRFFDYKVNVEKGIHIANYRDINGNITSQKTRTAGKDFKWINYNKKLQLFGQHTSSPKCKKIIITEGEIDCMTIHQILNVNKSEDKRIANVVSIYGGAKNALFELKQHFEFINNHNEIILAFDNDEAGQKALSDVNGLFEFDKTKKVVYPEGFKDANELLSNNKVDLLIRSILNAQKVKPEGIVLGKDIVNKEDLRKKAEPGTMTQFPKLNKMTRGLRKGQVIGLTGAPGTGKSTFAKQIFHHLITIENKKCGFIMLEELKDKTIKDFICIDNKVNTIDYEEDPMIISDEDFDKSWDKILEKNNGEDVVFYNEEKIKEIEDLKNKIRYMIKSFGVEFILLDHLSMVVAGLDVEERKAIDMIMAELASISAETGVFILFIVHLNRGSKNFTEGAQISQNDLRGSSGIEGMSHGLWALERNQQDKENFNRVKIRVLKNRYGSLTGEADLLNYNMKSGILELENNNNNMFEPIEQKVLTEKDNCITYGFKGSEAEF